MAQWRPLKYVKKQVPLYLGYGINTGVPPYNIADTEATYMRNVGSQDYPIVATRYGRSFYSTSAGFTSSSDLNAIGERNNTDLHIVDGNTWKRWNTASSAFVDIAVSLSSTEANIQDFATGTDRYTIMMNSSQKKIWDGTSTAADLGDANTPFTKIFTIFKGRIFAARDNDIMFSALNLPNDWTTAGVAGAGSIDVTKAKGNITGICEFNNHVIVFTEFGMHELYGDDPDTFELVNVEGNIGCISHKSIIKGDKTLYWVAYDGVYEYTGGAITKISDPVKHYIDNINFTYKTNIAAGFISDILYISIPYGATATGNNLILVFDTRINIRKWFIETGNFEYFAVIQNSLYGSDSSGGIWNIRDVTATDDEGTAISWDLITKPFHEDTISQKKILTDVSLVYDASTSATFNVYYSTSPTDDNSTSFTQLASSTDFTFDDIEREKKLLIPSTDLQDENWIRFRFSGTGKTKLHCLERDYRVKRR